MTEYPKRILPVAKQAEILQRYSPSIGNLNFGLSTPIELKGELGTVVVVREGYLGRSYISAVQEMINRLNAQKKESSSTICIR